MLKRCALAAFALIALMGPALAQSGSPAETAIRDALTKWMQAFNAGDTAEVCGLFARDLRYDYRGYPERGFDDICALLQRSLSDRTRQYSYSLRIKEILVSGDLAVVRLVWTLEVKPAGAATGTVSHEPGMDIFRRQPDGSWKIVRYIAYEN
jgi:uncharacterized protein (TIGR02246 family)